MKNITRTLTVILFLLLTVWACDKEVSVISSFDFTLEESHEEIATINLPQKTVLIIKPEKVVSTNVYRFKYEVLKGEGNYIGTDGSVIPQNEFIPLNALSSDLGYKGTSINVDKVKVTVADREGNEKTIDINYDVRHNSYNFEASTPVKEVNVNASRAFSTSLFNTGNDKTVHYERAFFIIQGTAKILNADESEEIEIETFEPISEGTVSNIIKFSEAGESKLLVSTRDSNGQVKNDTINFNVNVVDFSFTAASEKNTVFVGEDVNVNFNLSENQGSGGQYQMRYVIDEGSVNISTGGVPISAGTLTNVSLGNFSWSVRTINEDIVKLRFIVRNESGAEVEKGITINIASGNFDFNPVVTTNQANINDKVAINATIIENGPSAPPYKLSFSSSGTGVITYNGNTFTAGQVINDITDLNFAFEYTGLTMGEHEIKFNLANANGAIPSDPVVRKINFNASQFTITATPEKNNVNLQDVININYNITEENAGRSYQMRYTIETGDVFIRENGSLRNAGISYSVPVGNFTWVLEPTSTKPISITFFVKNDNEIEKQATIVLDVIDTAFDFELLNENSILTSGTSQIELSLTGSSQQSYTIAYNIFPADGSTLFSNGVVLTQNSDLPLGSLFAKFNFEQARSYEIEFIVSNNLGNQVVKSALVKVNQTPFSANITNNNIIMVNQPLDLNLSLGGNNDLAYALSYSINSGNGSFNIANGSTINQGSTPFIYTPTSTEEHNIDFTITDNFNNSTTINKIITVQNTPPVISGSVGSWGFIKLGQCNTTFPSGGTRDDCDMGIAIRALEFTSETTIQSFRIRRGTFTSAEAPYTLRNQITTSGTIQVFDSASIGRLIINTSDTDKITYGTGGLKIKMSEAYEIQIKDSNGLWSDWVNAVAPSLYPN